MDLRNEQELLNTRRKLLKLEELYEEAASETDDDEELREAELESVRRLINQLKEEIARYEAHQTTLR